MSHAGAYKKKIEAVTILMCTTKNTIRHQIQIKYVLYIKVNIPILSELSPLPATKLWL